MNLKRCGSIMLLLALVLGAAWAVVPGRTLAASQQALVQDKHAADDDQDDHDHADGRHPHGDKPVVAGLIKATAEVTGQRPRAVQRQLNNGRSIAQIALASDKTAADVLTSFDRLVDQAMARAVANGRLPQSVADARAAWFKQSARLQIEQPGLMPRFPGLHEVHVVMISAAVEVSGLPRSTIRAQLTSCKTLAEIVAATGKTGADVSNAAMATFDRLLQQAVESGKLSPATRDAWRAALVTTTTRMTSTPGLHVAGKQCAS